MRPGRGSALLGQHRFGANFPVLVCGGQTTPRAAPGQPWGRRERGLLTEGRSSREGSTRRPPEPLEPFPEGPRGTGCTCSRQEQDAGCQAGECSLQKVSPDWGSAPGPPAWISAGARINAGDLLSYPISLSHSPASLFHFTLLFLSLLQRRGKARAHFHTECGAGQ